VIIPKAPVIIPEPAPVFTERPPKDFSTIFSAPLNDLFDSIGHDYAPEEQTQVLRPVHPGPEPARAAPPVEFTEPEIPAVHREPPSEPAPPPVFEPVEIIDAPAPIRSGLNSANEVADLLRGLDNPAQRARLAAASAAADAEVKRRIVASARPVRLLGWMSLLVGLSGVGLACFPVHAKYAVPVAAGGLLLATTGLVLAISRRTRLALPTTGGIASAAALALALSWGFGLLPLGTSRDAQNAARTPPVMLTADSRPATEPVAADYVPASSPVIVKNVQVRVVSAQILHPAVYAGDYGSLHTDFERRLQIKLELKTLAEGQAVYLPWRRNREGSNFVQLIGSDGIVLALDELAVTDPAKPVVLAASALPGPVALGRVPVYDVLLFDPPASTSGDLRLDLPGQNIAQPAITLHFRIPRAMVRVQGEER
jgi:hypothetical protein